MHNVRPAKGYLSATTAAVAKSTIVARERARIILRTLREALSSEMGSISSQIRAK
jgi:hypothetical protein